MSTLTQFISDSRASMAMFDMDMTYLAASGGWKADYALTGDVVGQNHDTAGMNDVIAKPIDVRDLLRVIQAVASADGEGQAHAAGAAASHHASPRCIGVCDTAKSPPTHRHQIRPALR